MNERELADRIDWSKVPKPTTSGPDELRVVGTLHQTTAKTARGHRRLVTQEELDAAADAWDVTLRDLRDSSAQIILDNETIVSLRKRLEAAREGWDLCLAELKRKDKRLEAAECPDVPTARALAVLIMTNKVPSPWRDTGQRLREIGKWLATIAGEKKT